MGFHRSVLLVFIFVVIGSALQGWEQTGIASWYGGVFQGRLTANGETYDTHGFTCAHKTLPFGTIVEVTNVSNGRTVQVRVNDRGPFVDDRIIDLTYAAAQELGMIQSGTAEVHLLVHESGLPTVKYDIQVGAWGDLANASHHRGVLETAGLSPVAKLGSDGITRIRLEGFDEADIFDVVGRLEDLGYRNLLVMQKIGD